jgi:hypothetical protein
VRQVVNQAVEEIPTQTLEINVTLPGDLPQARVDRDALLTFLKGILEEAALSGKTPSTIQITAESEAQPSGAERVRLTVRETQEVYGASDLPAVLSGPSGYGHDGIDGQLLAARSTLENQGGQIFVDTGQPAWVSIQISLPGAAR